MRFAGIMGLVDVLAAGPTVTSKRGDGGPQPSLSFEPNTLLRH